MNEISYDPGFVTNMLLCCVCLHCVAISTRSSNIFDLRGVPMILTGRVYFTCGVLSSSPKTMHLLHAHVILETPSRSSIFDLRGIGHLPSCRIIPLRYLSHSDNTHCEPLPNHVFLTGFLRLSHDVNAFMLPSTCPLSPHKRSLYSCKCCYLSFASLAH